jgi:hypothetical protein
MKVDSYRWLKSVDVKIKIIFSVWLIDYCGVTGIFANHFQLLYNILSPAVSLSTSYSLEFLSLSSSYDMFKTHKRLKLSATFGRDL